MSLNSNRADINRANSLKFANPRTEAGKSRSAMNALKHGLRPKAIVLPNEHPPRYQLFVMDEGHGIQYDPSVDGFVFLAAQRHRNLPPAQKALQRRHPAFIRVYLRLN